jgi:hypothetical protein
MLHDAKNALQFRVTVTLTKNILSPNFLDVMFEYGKGK